LDDDFDDDFDDYFCLLIVVWVSLMESAFIFEVQCGHFVLLSPQRE